MGSTTRFKPIISSTVAQRDEWDHKNKRTNKESPARDGTEGVGGEKTAVTAVLSVAALCALDQGHLGTEL